MLIPSSPVPKCELLKGRDCIMYLLNIPFIDQVFLSTCYMRGTVLDYGEDVHMSEAGFHPDSVRRFVTSVQITKGRRV